MALINLDKVLRQLAAYGEGAREGIAAGLFQEAEKIMAEAKQITPVDTGALRSTGFVSPPVEAGGRIVVEMGFGGPAAPYAIIVHEDLTAFHLPPTKAKFLEGPVNRALPDLPEGVARTALQVAKSRSGVR